jgi:hypothetical protein
LFEGDFPSVTLDSNQLIIARLPGKFSQDVQTLQLIGVKREKNYTKRENARDREDREIEK